jgi:hypothetical protein
LKSGSWDGPHGIEGVVSPSFFEGRWEKYRWPQKKWRGIEELLEQEKNIVVPNMTFLWGYGEVLGSC